MVEVLGVEGCRACRGMVVLVLSVRWDSNSNSNNNLLLGDHKEWEPLLLGKQTPTTTAATTT